MISDDTLLPVLNMDLEERDVRPVRPVRNVLLEAEERAVLAPMMLPAANLRAEGGMEALDLLETNTRESGRGGKGSPEILLFAPGTLAAVDRRNGNMSLVMLRFLPTRFPRCFLVYRADDGFQMRSPAL